MQEVCILLPRERKEELLRKVLQKNIFPKVLCRLQLETFAPPPLLNCNHKNIIAYYTKRVKVSYYSTIALILRMPAAEASSFLILNEPIMPVCSTCGPPHTSRETGASSGPIV